MLVLPIVYTDETCHKRLEAGKTSNGTQISENSCRLASKSGKR
jgi:hypothetical protein